MGHWSSNPRTPCPSSDAVVAMLDAARMQGKYWEALEALLRAQERWVQNHRV